MTDASGESAQQPRAYSRMTKASLHSLKPISPGKDGPAPVLLKIQTNLYQLTPVHTPPPHPGRKRAAVFHVIKVQQATFNVTPSKADIICLSQHFSFLINLCFLTGLIRAQSPRLYRPMLVHDQWFGSHCTISLLLPVTLFI